MKIIKANFKDGETLKKRLDAFQASDYGKEDLYVELESFVMVYKLKNGVVRYSWCYDNDFEALGLLEFTKQEILDAREEEEE